MVAALERISSYFQIFLFSSFATKERNGLLLYNGRYNDLNDFIALELVEGRVQFSYSLGAGPSNVRLATKRSLADGNWHTITINYVNRVNILNILCTPRYYKESKVVSSLFLSFQKSSHV